MLASGTQDRGFAPDRSRQIFPAGKIHSMPSFVQYQNNTRTTNYTIRTNKKKPGRSLQVFQCENISEKPQNRSQLHELADEMESVILSGLF
jgi:hypothetical protein